MAAFRKKPQRWPLLQPNAAGIVGCCGGIVTDGTTSSTHIAAPLLIVLAGHPISQFETILALLSWCKEILKSTRPRFQSSQQHSFCNEKWKLKQQLATRLVIWSMVLVSATMIFLCQLQDDKQLV